MPAVASIVAHARAVDIAAVAPRHLRRTGVGAALRRTLARGLPAGANVVAQSPADGALLVDAPLSAIAAIQRSMPTARVFEEHWYELSRRAGYPWLKRHPRPTPGPEPRGPAARRARASAAADGARRWRVRVTTAGAPLADVTITLLLGRQVLTAQTDARGLARFDLHPRHRNVSRLYADPLHSAWSRYADAVPIEAGGYAIDLPPLAEAAHDARNALYAQARNEGKAGVRVAVVDSGVGPHALLPLAGGRNTTGEEAPSLVSDPDGHGTHVAGVIAAQAAGPRRGEAAGVELFAYRVFTDGGQFSSNFWVRAAIIEAAQAGCHLINLSLGGGDPDPAVIDAVRLAWDLGCVCVAAAGNDGTASIDVPARYDKVLAVTALGLEGLWPEGTSYDLEVTAPFGKRFGERRTFLAAFSNHGREASLTAPGVAIISTIPRDRFGVMSGTSMASPVATGVIARRIGAAGLHTMPATAARAEAIVKLALEAAEDVGLSASRQGRGLAR